MALATATVTIDLADKLGVPFNPARTSLRATTNAEAVIDTEGDKIRLGSGTATINPDGTATIIVWAPGAGSNPASWQTTIHVNYPDPAGPGGRGKKAFGPFTIPAGTWTLADLVDEMPALPEYASDILDRLDVLEAGGGLTAITDRLDGVQDHGNVSGALAISPSKGFHVFDATAATTVTLGNPPGNSVAFKAITGASDVAVNGLPSLELTDDAWATFVYVRGAWSLASSAAAGGGTVTPVTDPPTQPGAITVTPTADGYSLSWIASTVALGYEGALDGGSYVDYGSDLTQIITGLTAGSSHSGSVRAYNSNGERSTARAWGPTSTSSVGLHEQLVALSPDYYLRTSRGSLESFGASSGWVFTGGTPAFDGPALMAGETGSAHVDDTTYLYNVAATALNGAVDVTVVALVSPLTGLTRVLDAPGLLGFGGSSASSEEYVGNMYARLGSTHLFGVTVGPNANPAEVEWRDGVAVNLDSQPFNTGNSLTYGDALIGRGAFGGGGGFYVSHYAVFVDKVLTASEMMALATAAGTVGNPA